MPSPWHCLPLLLSKKQKCKKKETREDATGKKQGHGPSGNDDRWQQMRFGPSTEGQVVVTWLLCESSRILDRLVQWDRL